MRQHQKARGQGYSKNAECVATRAESLTLAESTFPFLFQLLTKYIRDNPSGDVTISSSTLPDFYLLFFPNVFNLNFHVLSLNFQPFVCLCSSPQHLFPHNNMKLVLIHVTAASLGSAHPQPTCRSPLFKLPPSGHSQHIFQHSQSPAFSSQQIPFILGYFLLEVLEALYPSLSATWLLWLWFRFFATTFFCD